MSLHSGGSWWFMFVLVTGGACGGPPAHVVGAVGADPQGLSSVGFEGQLWALLSLSCLGPLRMVFSLLPSSDDDLLWLCSHVICIRWDESSLNIFRFMVGLIEVCCFIMSLWSSSFSWCRCWSSVLYTTIHRSLWIFHIEGDGVYFV